MHFSHGARTWYPTELPQPRHATSEMQQLHCSVEKELPINAHPCGAPSVLNSSTAVSASKRARIPLLDRSAQQYLQLNSFTAFSPNSWQNSSSAIRFRFAAPGPPLPPNGACRRLARPALSTRLESGEGGTPAPACPPVRSAYCDRYRRSRVVSMAVACATMVASLALEFKSDPFSNFLFVFLSSPLPSVLLLYPCASRGGCGREKARGCLKGLA